MIFCILGEGIDKIMKKRSLLFSILLLGMFSMPMQASAQELINKNTLSEKYVNNAQTNDVLINTNKVITDYMKQKLSMYKVIIVDEDINKIPGYTDKDKIVKGFINYNTNEIFIHNDYDSENLKKILLHEIGHSIDLWDSLDGYSYKSLGKYSNTSEFQEIFKKECSYLSKYSGEYYFETDIKEFFADSFAIYLTMPDIVKEKAPKLFEYMKKISNLKSVFGWQLNHNNKWYYIENNEIKTGWFKDKNNKWYYFNPATGEMMTNVCVEGYSIGSDGARI